MRSSTRTTATRRVANIGVRSFGRANCEARVKRTAWTNRQRENGPRRRGAASAVTRRAATQRRACARNRTCKSSSRAVPAATLSRSSHAIDYLALTGLGYAAPACDARTFSHRSPHTVVCRSAGGGGDVAAVAEDSAAHGSHGRGEQKGSSRAHYIDEALQNQHVQRADVRKCAANVDPQARRHGTSRSLSYYLRLRSDNEERRAPHLAREARRQLGRLAGRCYRYDRERAQASGRGTEARARAER